MPAQSGRNGTEAGTRSSANATAMTSIFMIHTLTRPVIEPLHGVAFSGTLRFHPSPYDVITAIVTRTSDTIRLVTHG